jgi:hypothetical protein
MICSYSKNLGVAVVRRQQRHEHFGLRELIAHLKPEVAPLQGAHFFSGYFHTLLLAVFVSKSAQAVRSFFQMLLSRICCSCSRRFLALRDA